MHANGWPIASVAGPRPAPKLSGDQPPNCADSPRLSVAACRPAVDGGGVMTMENDPDMASNSSSPCRCPRNLRELVFVILFRYCRSSTPLPVVVLFTADSCAKSGRCRTLRGGTGSESAVGKHAPKSRYLLSVSHCNST